MKKCWTHITSDFFQKDNFCSFSFHFYAIKKLKSNEKRNVCRLQKSYLWAKKASYLRSSANFSILLLKIQFSDITFTTSGIRMKSGAHIIKEKFSARCIYCGKIIFHSILFHLFMTFAYGELFAIFHVHFYNAFSPCSSKLHSNAHFSFPYLLAIWPTFFELSLI